MVICEFFLRSEFNWFEMNFCTTNGWVAIIITEVHLHVSLLFSEK